MQQIISQLYAIFSDFIEKNEKTVYNAIWVIGVTEHKKVPRLIAENEIGGRHIAVERRRLLDYPQHWHDYFEIEIVVDGDGTHILNGTAYPVGKGDAYLLTPVDFHQIETSSSIELINISFNEMWLSENMRTFLYTTHSAKMCRFDGAEYEHLIMASELLRHECEADAPCINQLLDYLASRFVRRESYPSALNQTHLTGIKQAVAYIELHFRERVTLQRLSAISGYNPTYFSELFRKVTGETYMERLTSLRINYAKALLASGVSVSDACFESGFGSLSNFLAAFKVKCGMPPSEYRKTRKR